MQTDSWLSTIFVALRHPQEPAILLKLVPETEGWQLPSREHPEKIEVSSVAVVADLFTELLGTRVWTLRQFYFAEDEGLRETAALFEVELIDPDWEAPFGSRWVPLNELDDKPFGPAGLHPDIREYLDNLATGFEPPERSPWCRPGWRATVRDWIREQLADNGLQLKKLEQVKQWGISTVLRARTDDADIYFKAPAPNQPLFVNEAGITQHLAERYPRQVPKPLSAETEKDWLLLRDFGPVTGEEATLQTKTAFFKQYAQLQIDTARHVESLLDAGCLDRRTDVLVNQVESLLESPTAIAHLPPEKVEQLVGLLPRLVEICRAMDSYSIPFTLVHGDLHLGNTIPGGQKFMIFDWTDACIAHPFMDLFVIAEEKDEKAAGSLLSAYLEPWQDFETPERLQELWELGRIALYLHQSISYDGIIQHLEPDCVPELDFTHYFLLKALAFSQSYLEPGDAP